MSITSSTHTVGHEQADGRSYVIERHTASDGVVHIYEYLAAAGTNYTAVRDARAVTLAELLAEQETDAILAG